MKQNKHYRLRKLTSYALKTKGTLLAGLLLTFLIVGLDLIGPYIIARVLDKELVTGIGARSLPVFAGLLAAYFLIVIISSITRYFTTYFFQKSALRVSLAMQNELFEHVQTLPISYFDSLPAGKVVSRVTNDTKDVQVLFQVVLANVSTALIYTVGIYVTLFFVDYKLALLALIPIPVILLIMNDYRIKSTEYNKIYRSNLSELNASLNESIQGMEIIQSFAKEDQTYATFDEVSENIYQAEVNITKLESYSSFNAIGTIRYLTIGGILLYFGLSQITGKAVVSVGFLYIFIDYMGKIFENAQNLIQRLGQLQRANIAADHIFTLLQQTGEDLVQKGELSIEGQVAFRDLSFFYKDEEWVLKDVDFEVPAGTTAAFVGHTGSGKSTIMNLLLRFYTPQKGKIQIDGKDMEDYPTRSLRDQVAIVLQDPFLFRGTILSNITLGDERISEEKAYQSFLEVGGREFLERHPQGLNTPISEKGSTFSAGERQLISFARALAKDPSILVLDEATANIDSETEKLISQGIERLKQGRTTLLIAHRLSTIKDADQIFVLDKGRIIERGRHDELIALNGEYKEMYLHQSKKLQGEMSA